MTAKVCKLNGIAIVNSYANVIRISSRPQKVIRYSIRIINYQLLIINLKNGFAMRYRRSAKCGQVHSV